MKLQRVYRLYYLLLYPIFHLLYPVRYHHRERLPEGPMLLCAMHASYVDPLYLCYLLGIRRMARFMAKQELLDAPLAGRLLSACGVFGVNRGQTDMRSIRTALGILRSGGIVGIFPEGTRVRDEAASDVKNGALLLASHTGAPIVPIYLPRKKQLFRRMDVVVGEPYTVPRITGGSEAFAPYAEELMRRIRGTEAQA